MHHGAHAFGCAGEDDVARLQFKQARQVGNAFRNIPQHLRDVAGLLALTVHIQPDRALVQRAHDAARVDRANRGGLIEGLADFPGAALLFHFALQVTAGHVQAQRVAPHAIVGFVDRNVATALAQHHDQFHFVVQVRGLGRVRHLAGLAVGHRAHGVGGLAEEERVFTAGETHFLGVFGVVAAHAVDAAHREQRGAAGNGDRDGRLGR
ncbi:hypothetical protein D3C73_1127070 [compost metagenome]